VTIGRVAQFNAFWPGFLLPKMGTIAPNLVQFVTSPGSEAYPGCAEHFAVFNKNRVIHIDKDSEEGVSA
jgi:hypothetical protein